MKTERNSKNSPKVLDLKDYRLGLEICDILGISRESMYHWTIKPLLLGKTRFYKLDDVLSMKSIAGKEDLIKKIRGESTPLEGYVPAHYYVTEVLSDEMGAGYLHYFMRQHDESCLKKVRDYKLLFIKIPDEIKERLKKGEQVLRTWRGWEEESCYTRRFEKIVACGAPYLVQKKR